MDTMDDTKQNLPRGGPAPDDPRIVDGAQELPEGQAVGVDFQEVEEEASRTTLERIGDILARMIRPQELPAHREQREAFEPELQERLDPTLAAAELSRLIASLMAGSVEPVTIRASESWHAGRLLVSDIPIQVAGRNQAQLRITLVNRDTVNVVFFDSQPNVTSGEGVRLDAGESITIHTRAPIYAVCASGLTATLELWREFTEGP